MENRPFPRTCSPSALFEPIEELPKTLAGLHGYLLADLLDATLNYGVVGDDYDDYVLHLQSDKRHIFVRAFQPDHRGITTIRIETSVRKTHVSPQTHHHIVCPSGSVYWPHSVKISDVRDGLHDADSRMSDAGFINVDTGVRTGIYSSYATGKLKIADFFSPPETVLRYPPNGLPTEVFLARFDQPNELARIRLSDGSVRICLKTEANLIQRKDEIRHRVRMSLRRKHGISSDEDLQRLNEPQRVAYEREMYVETQRALTRLTRGY